MTEIELLEQLLKTGRMPASQPPMAPFLDPSAPKPGDPGYKGYAEEDAAWKAAQSGASQQEQRPIQKIEQTNIVGEPIAKPKVIPKLEKSHSGVDAPTSRYGEMHRQWSNDPLALQLDILPDKDLVEKARQMSEEARTKYVQEAAAPIQGYSADTSQEDKALADLLDERKNLGDSPKTDIWAKAIYHLAPAILGALSGSSGRAAALPSLKMNIDSLRRDEDFALRTYNASKERLDKLERGLLASKKGKQDEAIRRSTLEIEKAKMRIDALRDNANMTAKERSEAIQEEQKKVENLVANVLGTSKEITTFEQIADEFKSRMDLEKEKLKKGVKKGGPAPKIPWTQDPSKVTAAIPSGYFGAEATHDGRTAISQKDAEMVRGAVGDMGKMRDAVKELIRVLPDSTRGMTAQKWTEIQSKARSAQNIYRGKSFADLGVPSHNDQAIMDAVIAAPSTSDGWQGFYRAFNPRVAKKLLDGFIRDQENQVGIKLEPYGVRLKGSSRASSGAQGNTKETKVVNGVTYEKAQGGWKRVK